MKKKGFTLIELIIVIAIISILAMISYPSISKYKKNVAEKELKTHTEVIEKSLRQYYAFEGCYPFTLEELKKNNYGVIVDMKKYNYIYRVSEDNKSFTLSIELK